MLDESIYLHPPGLAVHVEADGRARLHRPGAAEGILLDPHIYRIWSAAHGSTVTGLASRCGVSTYLAACAVTLLRRAGVLDSKDPPAVDASTRSPAAQTAAPNQNARARIPAIVVHHRAEADLGACLRAVKEQRGEVMGEVRVLAAEPTTEEVRDAVVIGCDPGGLIASLMEEIQQARGDAVLLLDSQVTLKGDTVAEMARVLDLRSDLGAIAPRTMWRAWPGVVASLGDWRVDPAEVWPSPQTGHVDVGQFVRGWEETPGVHFQAALVRRAAVHRVGLPDGVAELDWLGAAWSARARRHGYRTLAALHAVAYGPWPGARRRSDRARGEERDRDWPAGGLRPLVEDGMPALTVENVRGVYCHYAGVPPLEVRPRVVVVAADGPHLPAVVRTLAATCEVCRVEPEPDDEAVLLEALHDVDVVVASADAMAEISPLQQWPGPILLDTPPAEPGSKAASAVLRQVDGAVCIRQPIAGRQQRHTRRDGGSEDGEAWVITAGSSRAAGMGPGTRSGVMPLEEYCRQPALAPGREVVACLGPDAVGPPPPPPTPARALPGKAWQMLRQRGAGATVHEMYRYLRWKVGL